MTEKGKSYVFDPKTGKFKAGKASPWLPPEHMRSLPQDFTTKNPSDPDRIHPLDPPHIVEALTEDQTKAQAEKTATKSDDARALANLRSEIYSRDKVPITQIRVDAVKFYSMREIIKVQLLKLREGLIDRIDWSVNHLWFPRPYMGEREIRKGPPPPRSLRPGWIKDIDLVVDLAVWPKSINRILESGGVDVPKNLRTEYDKALSDETISMADYV